MGVIVAKLTRPFRTFNIENRTNAIISKDKPTRAPQFPAAVKQLEVARKSNPEFLENHYKKDIKLGDNLKNVYVTSTDPNVDAPSQPNPDRPLPTSRVINDFQYGFYIPDSVSKGKCTLKQIFDIITKHRRDPVKNNANSLATEYQLNVESVDKLLNYYKLYNLVVPEQKKKVQMDVLSISKSINKMKQLYLKSQKKSEETDK